MKTIINIVIVWVAITFIYSPFVFGDTIDEEVLVLFKAGIITIPEGKISAALGEITTTPEVLSVLQSINVLEITKGLPDFNPKDTLRMSPDGDTARLPDFSNLFVLRLPAGVDRDSAIVKLEELSDVIYAEKNQRAEPEYEPNDPYRGHQWYLNGPWDNIGAYRAFDFSRGSSSTRIGIIDTGVDRDHEDLSNKCLGDTGYSYPHGTHVAGIAAAKTNNNTGIVGLDWHARIWAENYGNGNISDLTDAVISATNAGCKILNNSWGINDYSQTLYSAFLYAYQMGALPVSSMSNTNAPHDYPKRFGPWMMNVGATNIEGKRAPFSVTGYWIDVGAPGDDIYSTLPGNSYGYYDGTSMAAPVVSGIAGLLLGANPNLKNYDLEWIIKYTATDFAPPGFDDSTGYGRVNADTAVKHLFLPYELSRSDASAPTKIASNVWRAFLNRAGEVAPGKYICDVYKLEQTVNFTTPYAVPPFGWFSVTGYSNENPNYCKEYLYRSATTTTMTLRTYFYWVKYDVAGNYIGKWAPVDPNLISRKYVVLGRKPINSPTNLKADGVPNSNSIKLTWTDNSHNELQFKIERSINGTTFYLYDSVAQNVTQYIDNGTTSGQRYWYRVQAWAQEFHSGYSNIDDAVAGLAAPSNLSIVNQPTMNSVKIQWTDNSLIEAGFQIARRVDGGAWNENYKTVGVNTTQYTDTVSFLHKYHYKIRAYDNAGHYSAWSNIVEFTSGVLAQSPYPKMSAFNSNCKVVRGSDGRIHVLYYNGNEMYYSNSSDQGISFKPWQYLGPSEYNPDTIPAIALDKNGVPYIAFGENYNNTLMYWVRDTSSSYPERIFLSPSTSALPYPPSFVWAGDTGFVVFKDHTQSDRIIVARYPPSPEVDIICVNNVVGSYPAVVYDRGGRIVVLVVTPPDVKAIIYYRTIGTTTWNSLEIPNCWWYGMPSLWAGTNELRMVWEGVNASGQAGLFFLRIPWENNTYNVNQPAELVSDSFDFDPDYMVGYSYLAGPNVVLWKYNNDIWYAQRIGPGQWEVLGNLSTSSGLSCYPQGIVFGSFLWRQKLFALWTEKEGNNYYLVRKIVDLPSAYPPVHTIAQSDIPEATGYNNSRRLLRDDQGILHLVFTSGNNVYHTFLQDTSWSEPVTIGEGKYPALALDNSGKIYCVWSYNEGLPYLLEELRMSKFDHNSWSEPVSLMHTYNSFLWGVGAPSLAVKDSMAYITFKSYFGPTYHPAPGQPVPQVIVLEARNLIYGKFSLNNPSAFAFNTIDAIGIPPTPVAPLVYEDSLVPLLISPSITVNLAGIPHILWEGDSSNMRYYTILDTTISAQIFDEDVDFPFIGMNGDQIQLFYTARDSIKYRYSWTGTENLSQTQTVAGCESPFSSNQYLTWIKQENGLSHLYYGAIPASGGIEPVEINYSTDLIAYPQILFNPAKQNQTASVDLVWTEFVGGEPLPYNICYLNLPLEQVAPTYALDMGQEIPVPILVQRDGYMTFGPEDYQTIDYDSTELIYHLTLHSPHIKYKIRWTYYHQEPDKIKLQFNVDDILHHNRWVEPGEKITEEAWIPQACVDDNEITVKIKKLNGTIAVLSGLEIETQIVGGGGGPQAGEAQLLRPFFFERIYPNPTKGILKIRFNSPDERKVTVKLYDVVGRLAKPIFNDKAKVGINEFFIKLKELSAGVYFIRLETEGYNSTEKVILLR